MKTGAAQTGHSYPPHRDASPLKAKGRVNPSLSRRFGDPRHLGPNRTRHPNPGPNPRHPKLPPAHPIVPVTLVERATASALRQCPALPLRQCPRVRRMVSPTPWATATTRITEDDRRAVGNEPQSCQAKCGNGRFQRLRNQRSPNHRLMRAASRTAAVRYESRRLHQENLKVPMPNPPVPINRESWTQRLLTKKRILNQTSQPFSQPRPLL